MEASREYTPSVCRVRVKGKAEKKNFNGLGLIHFFVSRKNLLFYFNSMFDGFLRSVYGKKPAPQGNFIKILQHRHMTLQFSL